MIGFLDVLEKHDKSINLFFLMPAISMFFIWVYNTTTINFVLTVIALGISIFLIAYVRALALVVNASPKAKKQYIQKFREFDRSYYRNRKNFPLGILFVVSVILYFIFYLGITIYLIFVGIKEDVLTFGSLFLIQIGLFIYASLISGFVGNFLNFYKVKL